MLESNWFLVVWAVFALIVGALNAIAPEAAWRLNRWPNRNGKGATPGPVMLMFRRILGCGFVVAGIVALVVAAHMH